MALLAIFCKPPWLSMVCDGSTLRKYGLSLLTSNRWLFSLADNRYIGILLIDGNFLLWRFVMSVYFFHAAIIENSYKRILASG